MIKPEIKYIVLDVLRPHQPHLPSFALLLRELTGIKRVEVSVVEIDDNTESLKLIIQGIIKYEDLRAHMSKHGAAIKSVDRVIVTPFQSF